MNKIVFPVILISLIGSAGHADQQTQCDLLASYERDHMSVAPAVDIDALTRMTHQATVACQNDLISYPDIPRLKFQLARVLLADDLPDEGLAMMQEAADIGYPAAQYWLGLIYREGTIIPQDNEAAAEWYSRAAEAGNSYAMYNLAVMKRRGNGVQTDLKGAFELYQRASDLGHINATTNLGTAYLKGLGVSQNDEAAFTAMLLAAERGSVDAMYNLGFFHEKAIGTSKNIERAIEWYQKAADHGDQSAAAAVIELSR